MSCGRVLLSGISAHICGRRYQSKMTDILCRWVNSELQLSKPVDGSSLARDFSSGYLLGKVLHKYQLQDDFDQFSKSSAANSKLNNFIRLEPTLLLLGVPFDLGVAKAVIQEREGAATRLLYQLYIVLQKKKRLGLTGVAMETLRPAATARLHRVENNIYTERMRTVVRREADLNLQRISQRFEVRGREIRDRASAAQREQEQRLQRMQEELRLQDVEKRRTGRRKQQEVMTRIQGAIVQIPKPPPDRTLKALERQRQTRKQREIQGVYKELAQFEKNLKKLSPTGCAPSSFSAMLELPHSEAPSSQRGRTLGPEDTAAREERAKRRRRFLTDQQRAHEELQDRMEEEQLVERLTRQTQQERRLAVQLMQVRQQKDVIRQNRVFRERQYQEQRQRDFEEALDREAALARQAQWDHAEEIRREREQHDQIAAEQAQERYRKHFLFCREVLEQVVDLATKAGEYRLLTGNLIPGKMVREWKELLFAGKPLYDGVQVEAVPDPPTPEQLVEMEKLEILNCQDYDEYSGMMGEWAWPEEQEAKQPPSNNNILGHVVNRLRGVVDLPPPELPPPSFPNFTLKACVLGKVYSGKTTSLARIAQAHGVQVLSVSTLVQEAVQAFQAIHGATEHAGNAEHAGNENKMAESRGSSSNITDRVENGLDKGDELSVSRESGPVSQVPELKVPMNEDITSRLSVKAQYGAVVEKILRKGQALPDELQVDIVVEGVRQVPAGSGWVLDGFPSNLAQAKLLEKALRGSDPDPPDRRRGRRRASLAVNPNPPREAPPPLPALDLVLLLDLSDSAALDRAGKQADELETHPPSEGDPPVDPGAQDSAPPPPDRSLEKRQIQHRITAFQDTWPKLERWFSRKQGVLVQVNGEVEEDALYRKVESAMFQAMARKAETATGEDAEDHGEKIVRSTPVASTALSPVPASPSAAPAKSTPALAQEPLGRRRSRSKSSSRSPKGSRSRVGSGKDGKGKKPETPDGKSQRKRSKSGSARSGGSQGRSRGVSMSSPLEAPQGENAAPPEDLGPPPGSEDWVYVDEPLPKEISEYLVPYWENACSSYESNVKTVMQNLRGERNLIIRHLYNIREDFKQYLRRPDEKQELVSRWQQDYNAVPEDMRSDERTKAELHQRLDDLRERLWDVADGRREDAERERTGVMGDGWLDDHSGVLVNHFCSLMQVEVDRFQDSVYVLRDYYRGMCGRGLPEPRAEFVRIPLLDLTNGVEGTQPDRNKSPPGSAHSERKTSSSPEKKDSDGEEKKSRIVPLIPRRPPSAEALTSGGDPAEPSRDERLLCDIWQTALTAVSNMVSAEQQQREEEEENEEQLVQRPRVKRMSVVSARASSAKDKKKAGKKKSGATPVPDPTPPPPAEEDTALLQRKALRAKIRQEYGAALDHEARAAVVRLELIKARALSVVRSLQRRAAQAYGEMEEWNGARFLAEMTSIDRLAEVGRHHIERAAEIEQELVLRGTEFFLNGDVRVVPVPVPAPRPPSVERPAGSRLSVLQLEALHAQLLKVAPEGVLSPQQLAESLQQLISTSFGSDSLPEPWLKLSEAQVLELVSTATQGSEVLDWRLFLLGVALPWPIPTQRQLLQTLARFKAVDTADTGFISEEQYLQMDLWFPRETSLPIPDHPSEPLPYDRLSNLRKFFFALFADGEPPPARLDYVNMLLYFASHPDPQQGFVRALSIVTGRALQYRPRSAPLLKSVPYMEECESSELGGEPAETAEGGAEGGEGEEEGGVSIPNLLKVICHGGTRSVSYNRFHPDGRNREEYEEDFGKVFRDLGFRAEEKVPFGILSQHPLFQELMDSAPQYQLTDLHQLLQAHLSEGKSAES